MQKRYEARGMMEWHPLLSAGKARIRIPFTGGHLSGYATTPASFETSDPVVQTLIEHSHFFRTGRIRLAASFEITDKTNPSTQSPQSYPSPAMRFASLSKAALWLSDHHGILPSKLLSEKECIAEAAALGLAIEIDTAPQAKNGGGR